MEVERCTNKDDAFLFSSSQMIVKTPSAFFSLNFSNAPVDYVVGIEVEYMYPSDGVFSTAGQQLLTLQSDQIFSLSKYTASSYNGSKRSIVCSIPLGADPVTFFSKQQATHWFPRKTSLKEMSFFLRTENGSDLVMPVGQTILVCFRLYHDMHYQGFQSNNTAY
jgi:hypothetical protein